MVAGLFANTMWIAHLNGIDRRELDPLQYPGALATQGRPVAAAEPYPELAAHIGTRSWRDGCLIGMYDPADSYADCGYGDPDADVTVAIVGHSHADTYVEPLHLLGLEHGFRVVPMLREACPIVLRTSRLVDRDCVTWAHGVVDRLVELDPDMVVSVSTTSTRGWRDEAEWVVPGAEDFWAELAERGIPFLGLRDNPRLVTAEGEPFYPNRCMNRVDHWSECAVPRERMYDADNPADPILAQWDTARSVDTSNWFCPNGWCQPVIGNVVVYRDRDHMTNAYARSLAPMLWEHLERHLADTGAGARRAG